jgi:hypothetical protein
MDAIKGKIDVNQNPLFPNSNVQYSIESGNLWNSLSCALNMEDLISNKSSQEMSNVILVYILLSWSLTFEPSVLRLMARADYIAFRIVSQKITILSIQPPNSMGLDTVAKSSGTNDLYKKYNLEFKHAKLKDHPELMHCGFITSK